MASVGSQCVPAGAAALCGVEGAPVPLGVSPHPWRASPRLRGVAGPKNSILGF